MSSRIPTSASQPSLKFIVKQCGMTLLELLVVMVILAMVSALLVQGMGSALITYERVQRQQQQSMQPTLAYSWLQQTLSSVQAELDEPRHFIGNNIQLSGYTHQPLVGQSGQVSSFSWRFITGEQDELQLWYSQPKVQGTDINWKVLNWPAGTTGQFVYFTGNGETVPDWPLVSEGQALSDGRIPHALFMEIIIPHQPPQRWYVQLPGRTFPRNDYRDF